MTSNLGLVEVHGYYRHACVNCRGETDDSRLILGLPCQKCIPDKDLEWILANEDVDYSIYKYLKKRGILKNFERIYKIRSELKVIDELFNKATGSHLWSAQRTWAIRVLKGDSFSIVAPTGTGKSIFGILMSIYFSKKKKKSYLVVPTTPLVIQMYNRAVELLEKMGISRNIVYYHSKLPKSEREEAIKRISEGNFDILITTSTFLSRKFDVLESLKIDFIFVDDVDSILKSSKNIDRVLMLMGFTRRLIDKGLELIKIKRNLPRIKDEHEKNRLLNKVRKIERKIERFRKHVKSVLVVSSATGRPRGIRVRLFREFLGFEVGTRSELVRNISDLYVLTDNKPLEPILIDLVKKLGGGGLIFVPVDRGLEYAQILVNLLKSANIKADILTSGKLSSLEKFVNRELDVLVGVAVYYGVMVRGLDLPEQVRYAIFVGVPKFKFSAKFEDPNPSTILRTLGLLYSVEVDETKRREIERLMNRLKRLVMEAPFYTLAEIREKLIKGEEPKTIYERIVYDALVFVRTELEKREVIERLKLHPDIRIIEESGNIYILIPDVMTYIQASGRTSRMYVGGLTKGLSIVIVDDEKLLQGLIRRSRWIVEEMDWHSIDEVDLNEIIRLIDEDRKKIRLLREGKVRPEFKDPIKTNLLIVESPNKARTIANFFGKPSIRKRGKYRVYEVSTGDRLLIIAASGGHVYDIITDYKKESRKNKYGVLVNGRFIPIYTSIKRCVETGYQFSGDDEEEKLRYCGEGEVIDKIDVVKFLQELAMEVDKVIIGTDPDAEGEKIGWDLAVLIRPYTRDIERIEFHEVTKRAILRALDQPRDFDLNLVEAQIVRRIEDRWIGFYLSEKLKEEIASPRALSAGRVQTPVLGWIINRWSEWRKPENKKRFFRVLFDEGFDVEYSEDELPPQYYTVEQLQNATFKVDDLTEERVTLNPLPPYTTATMIEDASRKLYMGADTVMKIAQELFEMGLITYHRTDSTRVSTAGQLIAKEYMNNKYPDLVDKLYRPRSWGEGGAHECIRPTRPLDVEDVRDMIMEGIIVTFRPFTWKHQKLYDMIFRRFMASQAAPATLIKQKFKLVLDNVSKDIEIYTGIIEEGFRRFVPDEIMVVEGVRGDTLRPADVVEYIKSLTPLYRQGDVIRLMRERRIGRPSTYAKIVEVLLRRKYVFETKKQKYLMPYNIGIRVYNYLIENYRSMVSEERTRLLEEYMDKIEAGEVDYQQVLKELYDEIVMLDKAPEYIKK